MQIFCIKESKWIVNKIKLFLSVFPCSLLSSVWSVGCYQPKMPRALADNGNAVRIDFQPHCQSINRQTSVSLHS
jgi:hypothetical protein